VLGAVLVGLFAFLPLPHWHRAKFVIEPVETVSVRAGAEGFIGEVLVREGEEVQRGTLLAIMHDHDLQARRDSLQSEVSILDRSILAQSTQGAVAESLVASRRRAQLIEELSNIDAQRGRLNIRAPEGGVVITPKLEQKAGMMLKEGDEFCSIAKSGSIRARIRVDDWDLEDVNAGSPVKLWLNATPGRTVEGRVESLSQASELHQRLAPSALPDGNNQDRGIYSSEATQVKVSAERPVSKPKRSAKEEAEALADEATSPFEAPLTRFDALIELGTDQSIKPGMSGEAKVFGANRPLAVSLWQGTRDWFRSRIWW
jgi:multidrug resistance efflux pump